MPSDSDLITRGEAKAAVQRWRTFSGQSVNVLVAALDAVPAAEGRKGPDDLGDAVMLLMRCVRRLQADDPVGAKAVDWMRRRNLTPSVLR